MEKSHKQTTTPGTAKCRSYKYLFHAGIEPAPRSAAVDRSANAPTVFYRQSTAPTVSTKNETKFNILVITDEWCDSSSDSLFGD